MSKKYMPSWRKPGWDDAEIQALKEAHEACEPAENAKLFWAALRRKMKTTRKVSAIRTRASKLGLTAKTHEYKLKGN